MLKKVTICIVSELSIWHLWSHDGSASNSELFEYSFNTEKFCLDECNGKNTHFFFFFLVKVNETFPYWVLFIFSGI